LVSLQSCFVSFSSLWWFYFCFWKVRKKTKLPIIETRWMKRLIYYFARSCPIVYYFNCFLVFFLFTRIVLDINAQNNSGDTPLHEAVRNVQTTIIDFLLKHEADSSILNEFHMAPIHLSIDIDSLKSLEVSTLCFVVIAIVPLVCSCIERHFMKLF